MARSILDIVIACKGQQPATEGELRLAVVALSHLLRGVERSERDLVEAVLADKPAAKLRAQFARREAEIRFRSKKMAPADYLGPGHTPGTPENLKLRKMAAAVFEKATGEKLT
jgi:hypothetical protein